MKRPDSAHLLSHLSDLLLGVVLVFLVVWLVSTAVLV